MHKQPLSTSQELLPVIHESSRPPLPRSTVFHRLGGLLHSSADSVMPSSFHTGTFLRYCSSTGGNSLTINCSGKDCKIALLNNSPSFSVFEATQCSTISPLLEKIWTPPLTSKTTAACAPSSTMWRNLVVSGGRHKEEKKKQQIITGSITKRERGREREKLQASSVFIFSLSLTNTHMKTTAAKNNYTQAEQTLPRAQDIDKVLK